MKVSIPAVVFSLKVLTLSSSLALSVEEIQALLKKPHDRKGLSEEMKLFPDARKFRAENKLEFPKDAGQHPPVIIEETSWKSG